MTRARRRLWLAVAATLAGLVTLAFLVRLVMVLAGWHQPPVQQRPVEGWMTPRFLVRAYDLPPDALAAALGLEPGSAPRLPLDQIARQTGVPLPVLLSRVEALRPGAAP